MNYDITAIIMVVGIIAFTAFVSFYSNENPNRKGCIVTIIIVAVMLGIIIFRA